MRLLAGPQSRVGFRSACCCYIPLEITALQHAAEHRVHRFRKSSCRVQHVERLSERRSARKHSVRCSAAPKPLSTSTGSIVVTQQRQFRWGSYVSVIKNVADAVDECVNKILAAIGEDAQPELAILFVTSAVGKRSKRIISQLSERLPSLKHIFGTSAYGVIGGGGSGPLEVEGAPAVSLTLGCLPGVDITLRHTLRSGIPDEDASPEDWADFIGVPLQPPKNLNLLMFSDSSFSHIESIYEGLDYAFPQAVKIGGVMSSVSGSGMKTRFMFCWSRPEPEAPSRQGPAGSSDEAEQQQAGTSSSGEGGLFGGLFAGLAAMGQKMLTASSDRPPADSEDGDVEDGPSTSDGMYMYGAVVMALHGDIQMDLVMAEGWRFMSPKTWRIVEVLNNTIVTTVRADEGRLSGGEDQPPLEAIMEHIAEVAEGKTLKAEEVFVMMNGMGLAVAPDTDLLGRSELELDDFRWVELETMDDATGYMKVGDLVQPGQRLRLAVTDEAGMRQDLRERMLVYKRRELGAMMSGKSQPPAFGALLLTDVERGEDLYGQRNFESGVAASYLPVPISGAMLSGQLAWQDKATSMHDNTAIVAVLRAVPAATQQLPQQAQQRLLPPSSEDTA